MEELQDFGNMLEMGFPSGTVDEDVIKEGKEINPNMRFESSIHEDLM